MINDLYGKHNMANDFGEIPLRQEPIQNGHFDLNFNLIPYHRLQKIIKVSQIPTTITYIT